MVVKHWVDGHTDREKLPFSTKGTERPALNLHSPFEYGKRPLLFDYFHFLSYWKKPQMHSPYPPPLPPQFPIISLIIHLAPSLILCPLGGGGGVRRSCWGGVPRIHKTTAPPPPIPLPWGIVIGFRVKSGVLPRRQNTGQLS